MPVNDCQSDAWKLRMHDRAVRQEEITHIFWRKRDAKWLREMLSKKGVPFRQFYIGQACVLTTVLTACPCCHTSLEPKISPLYQEPVV